ncbi:MAG: hypothetical protein KGJ23_02915 [Euryarchaeota archaeon]|nr:hypothetical protein [Euryarchaeota archaeon]MDE1835550.1 hypothetical protein [Euryarchaeota archaeon]MDE1879641.1 hypothetical protein [Euryarchaeota archaeon]MDE2043828.1 hypothetical protein [Thermoplasmata archaeon]
MARPPARRRFGHVAAWLRLRLPPPTAPVVLLGDRPPPMPPLDLLAPEPVSTDPTKRIFTWEEPWGQGVLRLKWDADSAEVLEAEYRLEARRQPSPSEVREFWGEVKRRVAELGTLPVEGADPVPRGST